MTNRRSLATHTGEVLHLFICGAGPAARVHELIRFAHADRWDVYCIATESAVEHFLDIDAVGQLTGNPVRTTYRSTGAAPTPQPDAVIVAPATYNTINKWAGGIADNYVLAQLAELTGLGVRIVVLPFVNRALANNPAFGRSVAALREAGARVLFGPGEFEPRSASTTMRSPASASERTAGTSPQLAGVSRQLEIRR